MAEFIFYNKDYSQKTPKEIINDIYKELNNYTVKYSNNNNNDASGGDIVSTINSLIEIITDFEEKYINFRDDSEININTLNIDIPYKKIDPKKFHRAISKAKIVESYMESNDNFLSFFSEIFGNEIIPRSIKCEVYNYDLKKLPVVIPKSSTKLYFDYGILLPNFETKFYVLGEERLSFYPLSSINSYQKILADILCTKLLRDFKNNYYGFAIYFLLLIYKFPISDLYNILKELKTEEIKIDGIEQLKEKTIIKSIYDKLDIIKNKTQIINIIVANFSSALFDYFKDEILNILVANSIASSNIGKSLMELIYQPWEHASNFVNENELPQIIFLNRSVSKSSYIINGIDTIIQEEEINISNAPIKKQINSYEQIIKTEDLIKNSLVKPIKRQIKVKKGSPVNLSVEFDSATEKIKYMSSGEYADIVNNLIIVTMPVSNWNDAIYISQSLSIFYNNILLKRRYGLCKYNSLYSELIKILNVLKFIDNIDVSFNTKNKTFEINAEYVEATL